MERIRNRFRDYEAPADAPYRLSLSIGAAVFNPDIDPGADKFIARLDSLMYLEKEAKKARNSQMAKSSNAPGADPFAPINRRTP